MGGRRANLWIGRLAGAAVLVAVTIAGPLTRAASPVGLPFAQAATSSRAARITAVITIRHLGPGRPSTVTIRLQPPYAARGGELLISMFQGAGSVINRRVLEPRAPGVYRAEFLFPSGGRWGYYLRFGPGQAGYVSTGIVDLTPEAAIEESFTAVFYSSLTRAPRYVQPLGYAAFGLIAALALAGIWVILARLRTGLLGRSSGDERERP